MRAAALALLFGAGCVVPGDSPFAPLDDVPPEVVLTLPVEGATAVPADVEIDLFFSEALDPASFTEGEVALTGPGAVAGALDPPGAGRTAWTFRPGSPLAPGAWTLTVASTVTDLRFVPLGADFVLTFETTTAPPPFEVTGVTPADGTTDVPIDAAVALELSLATVSTFASRAFITLAGPDGRAVPGAVRLADPPRTITYSPTRDLDPATAYTFSVSAGVKSTTGARLGTDFVSTFTTAP